MKNTVPRTAIRYTSPLGLAVVLLLASASPGLADDELTAQLGLRFGGEGDADTIRVDALEIGPAIALTYDHRIRPQGWLWTAWSLQRTEFDAPGLLPGQDTIELDIHYLHGGTAYRQEIGDRSEGFVMLGLGLTWVDPRAGEFGSEWGASALVGGGFLVPIRPTVAFRFGARGYATFTNAELRGRCGGAACSIDFSGGGAFQLDVLAGLSFGF